VTFGGNRWALQVAAVHLAGRLTECAAPKRWGPFHGLVSGARIVPRFMTELGTAGTAGGFV